MKLKEKVIACSLVTTMACLMVQSSVCALDIATDVNVCSQSMEEILDSFHDELNEMCSSSIAPVSVGYSSLLDETVAELNAAGYESYSVTPSTYSDVEELLSTDFSDIGLDPECSYIVTLGGEESANLNSSTRSSTGSTFTYTYNGTTYTMRYMTVTAADDYRYGKSSEVNLLTSTSEELIANCLNTVMYAYIGAVSTPLGSLATLCGLDIRDFAPATRTTFSFYGSTNWTRIYTQVLSPNDNQWYYGSSVEYAYLNSYYSGSYYQASTNRYTSVERNEVNKTQYSSNYNNTTWRKQKAVAGYLSSWPIYDLTDDVTYKHGSKVVITHTEDF